MSKSNQHKTLCNVIVTTLKSNDDKRIGLLCRELDCYGTYRPESIKKWYQALSDCANILLPNKYASLWMVIFKKFRWDFPDETLKAYVQFCAKLISINKSFIYPVIESLIENLMDKNRDKKCTAKLDIKNNTKLIREFIKEIYKQIPTINHLILKTLVNNFPNIKEEYIDMIEVYIEELLNMIKIIPEFNSVILQLIIEKITLIDIEVAKSVNDNDNNIVNDSDSSDDERNDDDNSDIDNDMENDVKIDDTNCEVSKMNKCLDNLMCLLFDYINDISNDDSKRLIEIYQIIGRIFERTILPTQNSVNVQFIMFYLCHFKQRFSEEFVTRLLRICTDVNKPLPDRCFSANYIGAIISRANYIKSSSSFNYINILIDWLNQYIDMYQKKNPFVSNISNNEANKHSLFYSIAHQLFKTYYYHYKTFDLMLTNDYNIVKSIYNVSNSCLQPLKYCHPIIMQNFIKAVKKSEVLSLQYFPSIAITYNSLLSKTFTNSQLFCFDYCGLTKVSAKYIINIYNDPQFDEYDDDSESIATSNPETPIMEAQKEDAKMDINDDFDLDHSISTKNNVIEYRY